VLTPTLAIFQLYRGVNKDRWRPQNRWDQHELLFNVLLYKQSWWSYNKAMQLQIVPYIFNKIDKLNGILL